MRVIVGLHLLILGEVLGRRSGVGLTRKAVNLTLILKLKRLVVWLYIQWPVLPSHIIEAK